MAISSGIDIVSIERLQKAALNKRFLTRVFTENELSLLPQAIKPAYAKRLACVFAAKEACVKALSVNPGIAGISVSWKDIEVTTGIEKTLAIELHNEVKELFAGCTFFLSISFANDVAIALVVMEWTKKSYW
jgi:phosphopantetheine--protein transferase-like protein